MARIVSKWMGLAAFTFCLGGVAAHADFADSVVDENYSVGAMVEALQANPDYGDQLRKGLRELKEQSYRLKEKQLNTPEQRTDLKNSVRREEGKKLIHDEVQRYIGATLGNPFAIGSLANELEKKIAANTGEGLEAKKAHVKNLEMKVASLEKGADSQVKQLQQQIEGKQGELNGLREELAQFEMGELKWTVDEYQARVGQKIEAENSLAQLEAAKSKVLGNSELGKAQKELEAAKAALVSENELVAEDNSSATKNSPVKLTAVYDRAKQTVRYELRPNQSWLADANLKTHERLRKAMGGDDAIKNYLSKDAGYERVLHEGGKEKVIDVKDRKPSEIAALIKDRRDVLDSAKRNMELKGERLALDLDRAKDEAEGVGSEGQKELKELKAKEAVLAWWINNKNSGITDECEIYKKALKAAEMTEKILSKCPKLDPKNKEAVAKKESEGKELASLKNDSKEKQEEAAEAREKLAAELAQKAAQGAQQYSQFLESCIASMQDLQTKSVITPIMNTVEPLLRAMQSKGVSCTAYNLVLNTFNQAKNACDPEAQMCLQNCQQVAGDPMAYQGCEAQCTTSNYEMCLANQFQEPLPDKVARTVRSSLEVGKEGSEQLKSCKASMASMIAYTNQAVAEMRRDPRLQDPMLAGKPEVIKLQRTLQEMQNQSRLATFTLEALNAEKGARVSAMQGTVTPLNSGLSGAGAGGNAGGVMGSVPVDDAGSGATGTRPTRSRKGNLPAPAAGVPGPNYLQQQRKR